MNAPLQQVQFYPINLTGSEDTGYECTFVDFPGRTVQGDDFLELCNHAEEFLMTTDREYRCSGKTFPEPSAAEPNQTVIGMVPQAGVVFDAVFGVNGEDTLILHHDDGDGHVAAACFYRCNFKAAKYAAVQYNNPVPWHLVQGKKAVLILDFSFDRETTVQLKEQVEHVIVLDHHTTSMTNLKGLTGCFYDLTGSGASMAHKLSSLIKIFSTGKNDHWLAKLSKLSCYQELDNFQKYCYQGSWRGTRPNIYVELADDYDQFKFKYGRLTHAFNEGFGLVGKSLGVQGLAAALDRYNNLPTDPDHLNETQSTLQNHDTLIRTGMMALDVRDLNINKIIERKAYGVKSLTVNDKTYKVILTTMSGNNHYNELARKLRHDVDTVDHDVFVNAFMIGNEAVVLNFRQGKGNVDVSKIAEALGGGGRPTTAGTQIDFATYQSLFTNIN